MKSKDSRNWAIVFAVLGLGVYLAKRIFVNYLPPGINEFENLVNSFYSMTDVMIYVSMFFVVLFFLLWLAGDKNAVPDRNGLKR